MKLIQRNRDAAYLQYDKYVDFDNPMVMEKAMDLTKNCRSVYEKIETIYYFVRDEIDHTWDAKDSTITISASDVLEKKTGISYSKANLLAALMRANGIYTGFCYQRIKRFTYDNKLALHALNAVFEPEETITSFKLISRSTNEILDMRSDRSLVNLNSTI